MMAHVVHATYVRDYILHIRFSNGIEGDVDLKEELEGEVFEPLKNRRI